MSILFKTLDRMIERGDTSNLESKIDIFFASGKLTEEEYDELIDKIKIREIDI